MAAEGRRPGGGWRKPFLVRAGGRRGQPRGGRGVPTRALGRGATGRAVLGARDPARLLSWEGGGMY